MLTKTELDAIRERCEKATPGPWKIYPNIDGYDLRDEGGRPVVTEGDWAGVRKIEDACFISECPTDIPALLAHIDALESERQLLIAQQEKMCESFEKMGEQIKELESQAIRWIPVGEKLPEIKGDAFLAYDCDEESMWIESSTRFMKWNNVTHWAELPAPPKEESC